MCDRIATEPGRRHVYGRFSPGYLDPCFYCSPASPMEPKAYIDDRLDFTLDFQNDYDIIGHQIPAMGFLADQIAIMQHYMNLLSSVE
ncbi:MAG: hypothetical protein WBG61_09965 [Desulfobacterales bacterium]